MRQPEAAGGARSAVKSRVAARWLAAMLFAATAAGAAEPEFRYSAPIAVTRPGAFVQLPLGVDAYAHAAQPELRDLRVVDARGERVPFALLGARVEQQTRDRERDAVLYPLPERPRADGSWRAPVEVVVEGDRVRVRQGGTDPSGTGAAAGAARPAGWLIDLGERKPEDPVPRWLRLSWSGPAEFTAGFRFETSADLRTWQVGGSGQLMALASPAAAQAPLTQPSIALPSAPGRFVRLFWNDPAAAPQVSGARVVAPERSEVALDAPTAIVVAPVAAPIDKATASSAAADTKGALYFDLGGVVPLSRIDLRFEDGTHVAPVRLQGRSRADEAWQELARGVFFRLERDGSVDRSPPLETSRRVRFVRVAADERAAPLDAATTRLAVEARLASLVFPVQGQAPFRLLAGSSDAPSGALAPSTLVPMLEVERARFGQASLGPWSEEAAVAGRLEAERFRAQWRPWLLWTVLVVGVAGLGFMVWRLARPSPPASGHEN